MFGLTTVRASVSMKHITADVILRNLIKFPTTYQVSRWTLSDVENSRPRKHWPRKRSLYITPKALRFFLLLLSKQFCLCFSLFVFFQYFHASRHGNLQNKTTFPVRICHKIATKMPQKDKNSILQLEMLSGNFFQWRMDRSTTLINGSHRHFRLQLLSE